MHTHTHSQTHIHAYTHTHTQELVYELNLIKMQSNDLALQFFSDLVRLQGEKVESAERNLGELLVSAVYSREKKALHVHVIQGKGLPPMDKTGTYISCTLCTYTCVFGRRKWICLISHKST